LVRDTIKKVAAKYGYDIRRIKSHNKLEFELTLLQIDNLYTHTIKIPLEKGLRTYRGVSLSNYKSDLYVNAVMEAYREFPFKDRFVEVFVASIKSSMQANRSMLEAFNLKDRKDLANIPECYSVLPWEHLSIEEKEKIYMNTFINRRNLSNFQDDISVFYSDDAWVSHAKHFYKMISSIKKDGFHPFSLPIVDVLLKDNDIRYIMSSTGNHRLISAFAAGVNLVNVKLGNVINIKNIENWTNVRNGLFSKDEAQKIFLDYFEGRGYGSNV